MSKIDDEFYAGVEENKNNGLYESHNGRLIVRNISFKATPEALKEHFSKFGTVIEVKLLKKPNGRLVGCGFVHYKDVEVAEKAMLATDKKPFLDRTIHVAWAVSKQKYTQNKEINGKKQFSSISEDENKPQIIKKEAAENTGIKKEEKNKMRVNRNARLIVRNISFKATDETLRQHFEPYGTILELNLLKKPDGKLVGCAFVHYKNVPMANKALLSTNMKPFLGRPISVDWAVAKNKYMQHVVTRQIEMEEKVKKEESDSDDDDDKSSQNISNDDVKQEIKSETGSECNESASDEDSGSSDDEDDDEQDDEEDDEDMDENDDEIVQEPEKKRIQLNDAEDGCTVFLSNIPFSVDNEQLREFSEKTGPVKYALICIDKLTEHSKGSGFVKFENKEDADNFLALPASQLKLEGQVMQVKPALKRENLVKGNKKESKDNRNLYLVKEGVIVAGTKAAVGVSSSDMAKRLALERSKTQMLKNLNRFVSRYRLVVSNLPAHFDDAKLRRVCSAGSQGATITEARVMRDLRSPTGRDGRHPSKGYGFVMFMRHEDALACLRKLNNNPDIFDANNRPIVSFSIEDRKALNARKKRLEKSIANNPLSKKDGDTDTTEKRGRKRKQKVSPDESYAKMRKFGKKQRLEQQEEPGKFVKRPKDDEIGAYTGLTAKQGSKHKMRNNHKLRAQAEIHRQTVKMEKKKSMRSIQLKKAARERIKQPKQKINKNKNKKRNKKIKSFDE